MKNFVLIILAIAVMFSSCKKEEETLNSTDSFSCKIDGDEFSATEISTDNLSNNLSITAIDAQYIVTIKIENINTRSDGSIIEFNKIRLGDVSISGTFYTNTTFDPSQGQITITSLDLNEGKISGTFFFEALEVIMPKKEYGMVNVTSGIFSNISF